MARLKQSQRAELMRRAMAFLKAPAGTRVVGARARPLPDEAEPAAPGTAASRERPVTAAGLGTNVRANNRATDITTCQGPSGPVPCSTQAEESIAAWHQYVLVAWNDGEKADPTTYPPPNNDVQGYGFSTNGGATFTDGGVPPKAGIS